MIFRCSAGLNFLLRSYFYQEWRQLRLLAFKWQLQGPAFPLPTEWSRQVLLFLEPVLKGHHGLSLRVVLIYRLFSLSKGLSCHLQLNWIRLWQRQCLNLVTVSQCLDCQLIWEVRLLFSCFSICWLECSTLCLHMLLAFMEAESRKHFFPSINDGINIYFKSVIFLPNLF